MRDQHNMPGPTFYMTSQVPSCSKAPCFAQDYDDLYKCGVALVFGPGTKLPDAAAKLLAQL